MTADSDLMATVRAYLDSDRRWAEMTDDEREAARKRRAVLGSLDDCHALNRHERGER